MPVWLDLICFLSQWWRRVREVQSLRWIRNRISAFCWRIHPGGLYLASSNCVRSYHFFCSNRAVSVAACFSFISLRSRVVYTLSSFNLYTLVDMTQSLSLKLTTVTSEIKDGWRDWFAGAAVFFLRWGWNIFIRVAHHRREWLVSLRGLRH